MIGSKKYFVTFIDACTRYCYIYLMLSKAEVLEKFKIFKVEVELQCETFIKCLRSDRGEEFYDPKYFVSIGKIHQVTAPFLPRQKGIVERKTRVLKEIINALLSYFGLASGYCGEAVLTAHYKLNRVSNKKNKITPYELWKKIKPNLNNLKVWGCRAIVKILEPNRKKIGGKGIEGIFLGYAENSKAYRSLVVEQNNYDPINMVIESRDAIFLENTFNSIPRPKDMLHSNKKFNQEDNISPKYTLEEARPKRGNRVRKAKT